MDTLVERVICLLISLGFILFGLAVSTTEVKEWRLVFKATTGGPFGIYDLYTSNLILNEDNLTAQQLDNKIPVHYKSDFVNKWSEMNVSLVKVSVFKDGIERAFLIFNGTDSTSIDWFTSSRLINTSYEDRDEMPDAHYYFSIKGEDVGVARRFYINHRYNGCPGDVGWMLVSDVNSPQKCDVDKVQDATVFFSNYRTRVNYRDFEIADCLAVFVERTVPFPKECPCDCVSSKSTIYITLNDTEALQNKLEKIRSELKIELNKTSRFLRTKISAADQRPSATGVGVVLGAGILIFVACLIIIPDMYYLVKYLGIKCFGRHKKHLKIKAQ